MLLLGRPFAAAIPCIGLTVWLLLSTAFCWLPVVNGMPAGAIADLKQDARFTLYHGLTNYFRFAYPEDELKPLSCGPLTRDRANPAHIEVNDVLGNYTLSIVDSLSTLAILASSPTSKYDTHNALYDFQRYTSLVVELYGDGSEGESGQGTRARGFDLDSKVQVFETTIRGVGGLLSAHLFAVGDLPIRGYDPASAPVHGCDHCIRWQIHGRKEQEFVYDGQLLRLAYDLAGRLLPAFHTPTGLPYPRVNLRYGTPFYENSPLNNDAEHGQCQTTQVPKIEREITETCSAGAGSLVLEFSTLSRLTGDTRFEKLAKRAFWAVWERRSASGLIGAGIDAETGQWISPFTGIGAGIDSFFEYSLKSHILLSGLAAGRDEDGENSPTAFLQVWQDAHASIRRHIYRGPQHQHPHYAQNDMWTGGPRLGWIDSLSAYYPGLLTLAGELEEATTTHLLYTALWTRYGALPERWNTFTGKIDAGLRWWGGRPEFIESTWYLYRATQDPWYLHVGEMTLRDIKRRCFTPCGWAGLQDVRTGEQTDRMESFFLGETAKYLYLLFDEDHPLNTLDAPFVFTTEGHPLVIPKRIRQSVYLKSNHTDLPVIINTAEVPATCPIPPPAQPFSISSVAARSDLFHAAALARLHQMPTPNTIGSPLLDHAADHPSISAADVHSPTNYTFYPWTLPQELVPTKGQSKAMAVRETFDLTFPAIPNTVMDFAALQRVDGGILVNSVSGLRFGLVIDQDPVRPDQETYRIYALSNLALGRDESIWLGPEVVNQINPADPHLSRYKDTETVDIILDCAASPELPDYSLDEEDLASLEAHFADFFADTSIELDITSLSDSPAAREQLLGALPKVLFADSVRLAMHLEELADLSLPTYQIDKAIRDAAKALREQSKSPTATISESPPPQLLRYTIPAMLSTGPGAAALPFGTDNDVSVLPLGELPYNTIFVLDDRLCTNVIPTSIAKTYDILVIRRGDCSFSTKLENIPSYAPTATSLKLVLIVSFPENEVDDSAGVLVRPLLDRPQVTPNGVGRRNGIPLLMVGGGEETWETLKRASGIIGRFDDKGEITEERKDTVIKGGMGVKRRVWFASQGIRISNLFVH